MKYTSLNHRQAKKLLKAGQDIDDILRIRLGVYLKNYSELQFTRELPYEIQINNRKISLINNHQYPNKINDEVLAPYDFVDRDNKKILYNEITKLTEKMEELNANKMDLEKIINEEKENYDEKLKKMDFFSPKNYQEMLMFLKKIR